MSDATQGLGTGREYDFPELRARFGRIEDHNAPRPGVPIELARVDHVTEAERNLTDGSGRPEDFAIAQVHATLALVEQQRIANLLTLTALGADRGVALDDLRIGVAGEVWEGLGLS